MIKTCLMMLIINTTGHQVTPNDLKVIQRAQHVCDTKYQGCVKSVQIRGNQVYRVLCGEAQAFDKNQMLEYENKEIEKELREHRREQVKDLKPLIEHDNRALSI